MTLRTWWNGFRKSRAVEMDFPSARLEDIRDCLLTQGCCVLRRAIPTEEVARYSAMVDGFYQEIADNLHRGEAYSVEDLRHIKDERFQKRFGAEQSFFKLLDASKFQELLKTIFGEGRYRYTPDDSYSRSIHGVQDEKNRDTVSFSPLDIHLDGLYHSYWQHFAVNFWVPFTACGPGTQAPGFAAYPVPHAAVREALGMTTQGDMEQKIKSKPEDMRWEPLLWPQLKALFDARHTPRLTPHFDAGDVMLISSWTPHGSFHGLKMTQRRRSLELRVAGDSWDPAIAA